MESKSASFTVALILTAFYYTYMPDAGEQLYWFVGTVNYHWAHIATFLHFTAFAKVVKHSNTRSVFWVFTTLYFLVIAVGFNEVVAIILVIVHLLFLVNAIKQGNSSWKFHLFVFVVALMSFAIVMLSPGNSIRAENFPDKYRLLYSLKYSILQTIRFVGTWAFNVPFILMSIVVIGMANKLGFIKTQIRNYRFLLAFSIGVVFCGSFVPYYATGLLGQHRTINFVMPFFLFLYSAFLVAVSLKFELHKKVYLKAVYDRTPLLLFVSACTMFVTGNTQKIVTDLRAGTFYTYKQEFLDRQRRILQNSNDVILPFKQVPSIFHVTDTRGKKDYWTDKCVANFYAKTKLEIK